MGVRRKIFSREQSPKLQELLWRGIHLQTFSCPGGGQGKVQISVRMREKLKMRSQELIFFFFPFGSPDWSLWGDNNNPKKRGRVLRGHNPSQPSWNRECFTSQDVSTSKSNPKLTSRRVPVVFFSVISRVWSVWKVPMALLSDWDHK